MRASFRAEDLTEGGGIWQGGLAVIRNPRIALTNGVNLKNYTVGVCCGFIDYEYQAENGDIIRTTEPYSCGEGFRPSEDGETEVTEANEQGEVAGAFAVHPQGRMFTNKCNIGFFITNAASAGVSFDSWRELDGVKVRTARIPQPERNNMKQTGTPAPGAKPKDKPTSIVITEVVEEVPWEAKAALKTVGRITPKVVAAGPKTTTTASKSAPPPPSNGAVDHDTLVAITLGVLGTTNPIPKAKMATAILKEVQANHKELVKSTPQIMRDIANDAFLGGQSELWSYEGGIVTGL